jgi:hypothetical protein
MDLKKRYESKNGSEGDTAALKIAHGSRTIRCLLLVTETGWTSRTPGGSEVYSEGGVMMVGRRLYLAIHRVPHKCRQAYWMKNIVAVPQELDWHLQ